MRVGEEMLSAFADGVWFVELASVSDPELIPVALAAVLDVQDSPEQPLLTTLVRYLDGQQALIILDNCEHLVDGAADFARDLLQRSRGPRILATSREILGVNGEATWRVRSLTVPTLDEESGSGDVGSFDAVRLFVNRAQAARAGFTLTAENAPIVAAICRRVDGIPLALELAAARVRAMSVEQIHDRLDERFRLLTGGGRASPRRQQTLSALVDWSFRLLDEDQQALFCRLAVFMGGFTAEAAESVGACDGVDAWDVLDLLMQLVDKSLVVVEEGVAGPRYRMLETLREYGLDRGVESGEADDAHRRHAEYFGEWVASLVDDCQGPREVETLDRMEEDHDNIRQALRWALDGDSDTACVYMHGLRVFWSDRGYHTEAQEWRTRALDGAKGSDSVAVALVHMDRAMTAMHLDRVDQALPDAQVAAKVLGEAGHAVGAACGELVFGVTDLIGGRPNEAYERFERAVTLIREQGTPAQMASTMQTHAWVVHRTGDSAHAWTLVEEALEACVTTGHAAGQGMCVQLQGVIRLEQGRYADARAHLDDAWELHVQVKNQDHQAYNLFHQARLAVAEGDYVSAYAYTKAYLPLVRRLGRTQAVCWALGNCGSAAAASGRHSTAVDHYLAALSVEGAEPQHMPPVRLGLFDSLVAQGNWTDAREQLALAVEPAYEGEIGDVRARCVEAYARLAEHAGDYELAARLLAAATAWRAAQPEQPVWWGDRSKFWRYECDLAEETRARVEPTLSVAAFATAWAAGEAMTLTEARCLAESTLGEA